ncbi:MULTISPECIES: Rpn family recombination-promoting nuclease/putative transposase [unclassified Candidatus Frackibacter]|uniref:Rpn family recombination-promoting nuclease/putative transposase n=1 Tax=unclassified Candidatus Frackibacter TaxID=2648818 RepID=UPI00087ED387|nr:MULTISPECIES: Rpn family recombination-promoting nuclease/putative transposase [unclassified Candidatus Frackibacter]SDC39700.1 conserved hypothetical protein (putative transposase or invertase) [Candidatus Frackibacter sp. WG11]SEM61006.1 conserved hypothetical protein (putative transposase or invertase) [Candidatus Frackibacter sp. WG12]SFL60899.1 conserved hypothetical protein (putative transposase or invertase) [Candidatus Frackibacter sp. WG13]
MSNINNPHDKFFKEVLGDLETSKDFIKNYLPSELLNIINIDKLKIEKDSFIDDKLEEVFSDLLYKVEIQDKEGYLYFLFEHKSYHSSKIALQLLKYMLRIWESKFKQDKKDNLPIIIPLVIYHGQREWNGALNLNDLLVNISEVVDKYVPDYQYLIYDLSRYSDDEIRGGAKLRVFLEILRGVFREDFIERFKKALRVLEELEEKEKGIEYFEVIVRYVMNAKEDLSVNDLEKATKEISSERSEELMTIAEKLREEVREDVAKNLLKMNLNIEEIEEATGLSKEKILELKRRIAN